MRPEVLSGDGYSVSFTDSADNRGVTFFDGDDDHTHDDGPASTPAPPTSESADSADSSEPPVVTTTVHADDHAEADDHHDGEEAHHGETDGHHDGETAHHGDHILVEAGGEVTVRVTVPADAAGTWEIGCFLPGHYEGGMFSPLTVEPVSV